MNKPISALDGRYASRIEHLGEYFGEFALMRARCRVEVVHALALDNVFGEIDAGARAEAMRIHDAFSDDDYAGIKRIEAETRHDVKACELYIRERMQLSNPNRIHFGLTSEDVNNLAYGSSWSAFVREVQLPAWRALCARVAMLAIEWADVPFPSRTHGQHATPTTAGKEMAVFAERANRLIARLGAHKFRGKLNGATGNYSAMVVAAPQVDWPAYSAKLISGLGLEVARVSTQIEDHDALCDYLDIVRAWANLWTGFCQDVWMYVSYGYLAQRAVKGEVGSSAMPHKVNPINFENAEGNFQLSASQCGFLSDKLRRSRMQRDLSGSTVVRNVGTALGHAHLATEEVMRGLDRVDLNRSVIDEELASHPEVLAEAVQSVLRVLERDDAYGRLKELTRGREVTLSSLHAFVQTLPEAARAKLSDLSPATYIGYAPRIAREVGESVLKECIA